MKKFHIDNFMYDFGSLFIMGKYALDNIFEIHKRRVKS